MSTITAVFVLSSIVLLVSVPTRAASQYVVASNTTLDIVLPEMTILIYPRTNYYVEACPDPKWMSWSLHKAPPSYDPLHWTRQQWKDYILSYPLVSAGFSLTVLLISCITLLVAFIWRCVQWCVGCCIRCRKFCSVGYEETDFLGDTKHLMLKVWIFLLLTAALSMVIWGMASLDKQLLTSFWESVADVLEYGNNVSEMLQSLENKLSLELAGAVSRGVGHIKDILSPDKLTAALERGLAFVAEGTRTTRSILRDTGSIELALNSSVLPGLFALAGQLGLPINVPTRRARQLLSNAAGVYDTLDTLSPALRSSLPLVKAAEVTRADMNRRLQDLWKALQLMNNELLTTPDSPAVVALQLALQETNLTQWRLTLSNLTEGMQIYNASLATTALKSTIHAAGAIDTGARALSPQLIESLNASVAELRDAVTGGPLEALQTLHERVTVITSNVSDISNLTITLKSGTTIPAVHLFDLLIRMLDSLLPYITDSGTADSGSVSNKGPPTSTTTSFFMEAVLNTSATISAISSNGSGLAASAEVMQAALQAAPDASAAIDQMQAAVASLSGTAPGLGAGSVVAQLETYLAAYKKSPNDETLLQLKMAALDATAPVATAVASFSQPLVNGSELAAAADSLISNVTALETQMARVNMSVGTAMQTVAGFQSDTLKALEDRLEILSSFLEELPMASDIVQRLESTLTKIMSKLSDFQSQVQSKLSSAGNTLNTTAAKIQTKIIDPGEAFVDKNEQTTKDVVNIVYPVWMSCWALLILLILLMLLGVGFNWPAGLVTVGLTLLAVTVIGQLFSSGMAFGMAVLEDACNNLEKIMMNELVQHSRTPQLAVVASYYLYNVPQTTTITLLATFNVNITNARDKLQTVSDLIALQNDNSTVTFSQPVVALFDLLSMVADSLLSAFDRAMFMMSYESVHPLYVQTKEAVCCDGGNFAYYQWCALTASGCLCLGAFIPIFYLLGRMDMLRERRPSCCSCCGCVCYRPRNRYSMQMGSASIHPAGGPYAKSSSVARGLPPGYLTTQLPSGSSAGILRTDSNLRFGAGATDAPRPVTGYR